MYRSTLRFRRSVAERNDPMLAWARDDVSFFAAGACHILAWAFTATRPGFAVIHLRPLGGHPGHHVYASDGMWAFDHCGWTPEAELLAVTSADYRRAFPGWRCERIPVRDDIETFCRNNNHRLPAQFPYPPWQRAHAFIARFAPGNGGADRRAVARP
jgi:hypothetical protein